MPIQGCGSLHMLLLPPKIFSHFQQSNREISGEIYFPRVNSNTISNSLEKLANFFISKKLEFFIKKNPVAYSFYEK
jgi:hypothetical protein